MIANYLSATLPLWTSSVSINAVFTDAVIVESSIVSPTVSCDKAKTDYSTKHTPVAKRIIFLFPNFSFTAKHNPGFGAEKVTICIHREPRFESGIHRTQLRSILGCDQQQYDQETVY
jgi:hypothetical protein